MSLVRLQLSAQRVVVVIGRLFTVEVGTLVQIAEAATRARIAAPVIHTAAALVAVRAVDPVAWAPDVGDYTVGVIRNEIIRQRMQKPFGVRVVVVDDGAELSEVRKVGRVGLTWAS